MKICVGDIVERKNRSEKVSFDVFGKIEETILFYDGFFLVLEIIENKMPSPKGDKIYAVARIMCSNGQLSWINVDCLRKI